MPTLRVIRVPPTNISATAQDGAAGNCRPCLGANTLRFAGVPLINEALAVERGDLRFYEHDCRPMCPSPLPSSSPVRLLDMSLRDSAAMSVNRDGLPNICCSSEHYCSSSPFFFKPRPQTRRAMLQLLLLPSHIAPSTLAAPRRRAPASLPPYSPSA